MGAWDEDGVRCHDRDGWGDMRTFDRIGGVVRQSPCPNLSLGTE